MTVIKHVDTKTAPGKAYKRSLILLMYFKYKIIIVKLVGVN